MVRGSIREKSHEAMPSCGGSSSATASLGYGSHGTKRAKSGCKSRSAWKTRSWILAPRRSGGLTTTCKDAVVWETRATESQEILTEGGASGFVCAAAGCRLPNRSSERPASTMRTISCNLAQISGSEETLPTQRARRLSHRVILLPRRAVYQAATPACLPTFCKECRYEYRHGGRDARSTVQAP